jgi:CBS domain-containing protein
MEANETSKKIMSLNGDRGGLVSISPDATLFEAVQLMKRHQISELLVIDLHSADQKLEGIISDRDIALTVDESKDSKNLKVVEVMTAKPITALETDDFFKMVQMMNQAGTASLPVTDENGKVVSIVTAKNLLEILVRSLFDVAQKPQSRPEQARTQH